MATNDAGGAGTVTVNRAQVSSRQTPQGWLLFHAPSARVVTLDPEGEKIWAKIENGVTDISRLVAEHREEFGLEPEVAAYRVISFLDVLRGEDFVAFDLAREQDGAPLLDVTLDTTALIDFEATSDAFADLSTIAAAAGQDEITTLRVARPTLTLAEALKMAEERRGSPVGDMLKMKALDLEANEISESMFRKVAAGKLTDSTKRDRRYVEVDTPAPSTSLADVEQLQRGSDTSARSVKRAVRRIIVIIIIIARGPIIVIVIDDGNGPTWGKSRNACKTVCV